MASPRLLLSVVVVLLAVEYSNAKCSRGCIERERNGLNDPKFIWGRKLLQGLRGESVDTQEKSKPADLDNSFRAPQTESDRIQKHSHKPTSSGNENALNEQDHHSTKNEGSNAFLEAADEVANLMRKDYKGADRPRRKPPINNHAPKN